MKITSRVLYIKTGLIEESQSLVVNQSDSLFGKTEGTPSKIGSKIISSGVTLTTMFFASLMRFQYALFFVSSKEKSTKQLF